MIRTPKISGFFLVYGWLFLAWLPQAFEHAKKQSSILEEEITAK